MATFLGAMFSMVAAYLGTSSGMDSKSNDRMAKNQGVVKVLGERNAETPTETSTTTYRTPDIERAQPKAKGLACRENPDTTAPSSSTSPKKVAKGHSTSTTKAAGSTEGSSEGKVTPALSNPIPDIPSLELQTSTVSSAEPHNSSASNPGNTPAVHTVSESVTSIPTPDITKAVPPNVEVARPTINDFELLRVIGRGAAAKVFLSRRKGSDQLYAIKAQKRSPAMPEQAFKQMLVEPAILKQLGTEQTNSDGKRQPPNPFVVRMRWVFTDKAHLFFALDFHPGGDLGTMLIRRGKLHFGVTRFYAMELVAGITALHAQGIVHRDLKPENVLIDRHGHIVLTDFGFAKALRIPSHADEEVQTTTGVCGTKEYLSPEVLSSLPHSFPVDMWSLGIMIYEMLVGVSPFMANTMGDMYQRILKAKVVFPEDKYVAPKTKDFICALLQKNPRDRLSRFNIKEHPYFVELDWRFADEKRYAPPCVPSLNKSAAVDTQNFEQAFLDMKPVLDG